MTLDYLSIQKKLKKRIARYSNALMSDTKWRNLFKVLAENSILIEKCYIKNVWDDILREITIPSIEDFNHTFNEVGINDVMVGGPMEFKEIERLEFPHHWQIDKEMRGEKLEPFQHQQDVIKIKDLIKHVGMLETEINDEKLIVYGYK